MPRFVFAAPLFLAASLSAQVPVTPRTPPAPKTPPATVTPAQTPRTAGFDRLWADDVATEMRTLNSLDFTHSLNYNFDVANSFQLATEARVDALTSLNYAVTTSPFLSGFGSSFNTLPVLWAQGDAADSLYRNGRDQLSRGDYRRAADLFKSLPSRYPNSQYVNDAQYWQAYSLYRIGGTPDLQQALVVLEARKPDEPRTKNPIRTSNGLSTTVWSGSNGTDAAGLAARIANVLSTRGMANDPAVKRALAAGGNACDQDDQSVRAEALSALMQNDAETGRQMAAKILANRDECSIPLRRNAVMLVGNKHDDAATPTLVSVAKSDPSVQVRMTAVDYLVRLQSDAAVNAVIDLARTDTSKQIQRSAVRALAQSSNPRARSEIRAIVENNSADESLRIGVIDGLGTDRITADDAAWLRSLYMKTTSQRIKERIISAVGRAGGDANNQWIMSLLRNDDEPMETRTAALQHAGRSMDVATLIKTYDQSAQRPIREQVLQLLSERKEPEALDKIVDIAKTGTDTRMRTQAIQILSRSKDPRASKLLMQLVDH
jgi:HEAT repeat protein